MRGSGANLLGTAFRALARRLTPEVAEVPPALEACEMCRETLCGQERWEHCPHRLKHEAYRLAKTERRDDAA